MIKTLFLSVSLLLVPTTVAADDLPAEDAGVIEKLPKKYSKDWVIAHDLNFNGAKDGHLVVIDVASKNRNYKGMMNAALFASASISNKRGEIYSAQTFYSRGTYGTRTDALVIYDTENLAPVAEVVLPGGKRAQLMTTRNSTIVSGNE